MAAIERVFASFSQGSRTASILVNETVSGGMVMEMDTNAAALLAHVGWVRSLARQLGDEDLAQEAWVAALRRPPREGALKPWLASVMRNARRMAHRSDERRVAREHAMADGAAPDAVTLLEEVELIHLVVNAVLALDEPYRETLLLHYYSERTSEEIGVLRNTPASTVRSHLKVGLERVRVALDGRYGERSTWKRALVPVAGLPRAVTKGVVMGKIATTTIVAAGVLGLLAAHHARSAAPPALEQPARHSTALRARLDQLRQQKPGHDALVAQIEAKRPPGPPPPPPSGRMPGNAWSAGDLDPEYIRQSIEDALPLFKQCFEDALVDHPDLQGRITLEFTIEGDPDVAGAVSASKVDDEHSTIELPELRECFEQTIYAARFPAPADHGVVVVSYPFVLLTDAPDGGE